MSSSPSVLSSLRSRLGWWVFVLLLVVPILEVAVLVSVGKVIGAWPTVALLLLESAIGAWLVKREGHRAWSALRTALATGRMPAGELADAALVLVGGTLLLTPGFVTDVAGFAAILPFTRPLARAALAKVIARRLTGAVTAGVGAAGPRVVTFGASPFGGATRAGGTATPGGARRHASPDDDVIDGEIL